MNDAETGQEQARRLPVHLDPYQGKQWWYRPGQSGNPKGRPKGSRSLSAEIRDILNDPDFIDRLPGSEAADLDFQGTPMRALISAAVVRALQGDQRALDWLARFGYGSLVEAPETDARDVLAPLVISAIRPREGDAPAQSEAS